MENLLICENVGYRKRKISRTLMDANNQRQLSSETTVQSDESKITIPDKSESTSTPKNVENDQQKEDQHFPFDEEIVCSYPTQQTYPYNYDDENERANFNIGGVKYQIQWSILEKYRNTRLGKLRKAFIEREKKNCKDNDKIDEKIQEKLRNYEFYFETRPESFEAVLSFYRKGKLHLVDEMCVIDFSEDLHFWGIDESNFDSCCLLKYQIMLHSIQDEMKQCGLFCEKLKHKEALEHMQINCVRKYIREMFESKSWWLSKVINYTSIVLIILSVLNMIISTIPELENDPCRFLTGTEYATHNLTTCKQIFFFYQDLFLPQDHVFPILEVASIAFFTVEFILRLYASHNKRKFFLSWFNWIDLLCIVPYYITVLLNELHVKIQFPQDLLFVKILRIFKLARYSTGLRSLGLTFKKSLNEFGILMLILSLGVILFSSLVYIAEKPNRDQFHSIPESFWWAVITISTVGYGDVIPITVSGKIIGMLTAIFGVVVVALPVATIVKNFGVSYEEQRQREIALEKKVAQLRLNRKKSNKLDI